MATQRLCSIPDCDKPVNSWGWCEPHYRRWKRHGDPLAGKAPHGEPNRYLLEVVLPYEGDECLIWPFAERGGYGVLFIDGKPETVTRIVCQRVHGDPPTPEHQSAHSCGKGHLGCTTKGHLSWKTDAGNKADMIGHDTRPRGERHGASKLSSQDVLAIRALEGSLVKSAIAARYGVSETLIGKIHRRAAWAWLQPA